MTMSAEQRIAELEAELNALRAEMQDFTYTVSHDLRAPLRHILSYVELVQEDAAHLLPDEALGFLHTISDSARHMGLLMEGLAELSRIGTATITLSDTAVAPLLHAVIAEMQALHPQRSIQWQLPPGLPAQPGLKDLPLVQADAALLRKALGQLLDNALKFSRNKASTVIVVSLQAIGPDPATPQGMVALTIQDNGAGFNPALQGKLFKPFQRLHSAQQFPGIGIGLAIASKIAQRLGGQLQIEGGIDQGCRVTLTLPAAGAASRASWPGG